MTPEEQTIYMNFQRLFYLEEKIQQFNFDGDWGSESAVDQKHKQEEESLNIREWLHEQPLVREYRDSQT